MLCGYSARYRPNLPRRGARVIALIVSGDRGGLVPAAGSRKECNAADEPFETPATERPFRRVQMQGARRSGD
jgi:hypothetical protein